MPNIMSALKTEIVRLARKETKAATDPLRKLTISGRKAMAELKQRAETLTSRETLMTHTSPFSVVSLLTFCLCAWSSMVYGAISNHALAGGNPFAQDVVAIVGGRYESADGGTSLHLKPKQDSFIGTLVVNGREYAVSVTLKGNQFVGQVSGETQSMPFTVNNNGRGLTFKTGPITMELVRRPFNFKPGVYLSEKVWLRLDATNGMYSGFLEYKGNAYPAIGCLVADEIQGTATANKDTFPFVLTDDRTNGELTFVCGPFRNAIVQVDPTDLRSPRLVALRSSVLQANQVMFPKVPINTNVKTVSFHTLNLNASQSIIGGLSHFAFRFTTPSPPGQFFWSFRADKNITACSILPAQGEMAGFEGLPTRWFIPKTVSAVGTKNDQFLLHNHASKHFLGGADYIFYFITKQANLANVTVSINMFANDTTTSSNVFSNILLGNDVSQTTTPPTHKTTPEQTAANINLIKTAPTKENVIADKTSDSSVEGFDYNPFIAQAAQLLAFLPETLATFRRGGKITLTDAKIELINNLTAELSNGKTYSEKELRSFCVDRVKSIFNEFVMVEEAEYNNLTVTTEDINKAMAGKEKEVGKEKLAKTCASGGISSDNWNQHLWRKLVLEKVLLFYDEKSKRDSSDDACRKFYDSNQRKFKNLVVQMKVITFGLDLRLTEFEPKKTDKEERAQANKALKELRGGADFDTVVTKYERNLCTYKDELVQSLVFDGTLYHVDTYNADIEGKTGIEFPILEAAMRLKKGEYSGLVEGFDSVRIIKCVGNTQYPVKTFDEVKLEIKQHLAEIAKNDYIKKLSQMLSERKDLVILIP
jgi:parvulin-like peptidyl-prolyl isomerase/predicted DNA-binding protein (MmcQ/YjbR family)